LPPLGLVFSSPSSRRRRSRCRGRPPPRPSASVLPWPSSRSPSVPRWSSVLVGFVGVSSRSSSVLASSGWCPPPSADDAVDPNCESTPARASQRVKPDAVRAAWQRGSAAARQRASLAAARLNGRRGVRRFVRAVEGQRASLAAARLDGRRGVWRLVRAVEGGSAAWWGVMGGVRGQFTSSEGSSSYSSDRCSPRRSPACPSRSPRRPPA
jgi:hypothetical protein